MGVVYLARHLALNRLVAFKVVWSARVLPPVRRSWLDSKRKPKRPHVSNTPTLSRSTRSAWQGREQRRIDQREGVAHVLQARIAAERFELRAEFGTDLFEGFGIGATDRFGQRSEAKCAGNRSLSVFMGYSGGVRLASVNSLGQ
jgi:hypothetical protein